MKKVYDLKKGLFGKKEKKSATKDFEIATGFKVIDAAITGASFWKNNLAD